MSTVCIDGFIATKHRASASGLSTYAVKCPCISPCYLVLELSVRGDRRSNVRDGLRNLIAMHNERIQEQQHDQG
jgi:hypothetical protein